MATHIPPTAATASKTDNASHAPTRCGPGGGHAPRIADMTGADNDGGGASLALVSA